MLDKALAYAADKGEGFLDDLKGLVRIPSVSFDGYDPKHLVTSAEFTAELMRRAGLEGVELLQFGDAPPYVYGEWCNKAGAPTVLLYAHHDVQPPMEEGGQWVSPPFEPEVRDGRLYGRGSADDKAGIVIHTAAIEAWLSSVKELPLNVKVIIEGEEEVGSESLEAFVGEYSEKLKADCLVVNDLENFDTGLPSLTVSLRGMVAFEVTVSATKAALHSGMWAGGVPDPVMGLNKVLATLVDDAGRVAVPGIWDDVVPVSKEELGDMQRLPISDALYREQAGMLDGVQVIGGEGHVCEKTWRHVTLTVTSIEAMGGGNVIMDKAKARVSLRLVADLDPQDVIDKVQAFMKAQVPWGLQIDFATESGLAGPWKTDTGHAAFTAAKQALKAGYDADPVFIGCGGSIPFVGPLCEALGGIPALLVGIEDPYTLAHSANESMHVGDFHKAIASEVRLFEELAEVLAN